jgi:HNH endonuclease/NUMOD4 motif
MEEWRDIDGFPMYEVSNLGRVRRKAQVLKPGKIPSGHLTVALCSGSGRPKSMYVHRLVASAFVTNNEGRKLVNHRNGNPSDNRLSNLEWVTHSENNTHGYQSNGRRTPHERKVLAIDANGVWVISFRSGADAAKVMGVTTHAIWSAVRRGGTCRGYRWIRYEDT